jgi:signal transduction histidine kinase
MLGPSARRPQSIASRLFFSAIVCSVLLLLVAGLVLSALYRRNSELAFDQRLDVYLRALVADVASPGDDSRIAPGQLGDPQFELSLSGWYWQITRLDTDKPEIRSSRSLFATLLPKLADVGVPAGIGGLRRGYVKGPDGQDLRMVEREIEVDEGGRYLVQVAATTHDIQYEIWQFNLALFVAFGVLALALAGTTALQVRYGLRPLRLLQEDVSAVRRGGREKIESAFSHDLAPLAGELNLLLSSNREILERARTQVGNLAHALKTPLSVITNDARAENSPFAVKIAEQATMMRDQVTWYLDRARAAARAGAIGAATDVAPVVAALVRTFEKIYDERGIEFVANESEGLRFRGERQDLEEMLGNLIDNAGKWASSRVAIGVEAAGQNDARPLLAFVIDDDGPGLPAASREAAVARGRRLDESKPGSGLGLSIVVDIATVYGGSLSLSDSPLGGLRVQLNLPSV